MQISSWQHASLLNWKWDEAPGREKGKATVGAEEENVYRKVAKGIVSCWQSFREQIDSLVSEVI
jgi:hypothetical protein